jgi:diguanylate cyclase (GGDEF)-like protein
MKFNDALCTEIRRSKRFMTPLSLIMFDIDHFKVINDSYGHRAGDSVLCEIVRLVAKHVRGHDLFARWGGEEFMIMTTHTTSGGAKQFAEKLRHLIECQEFDKGARVTCSFGVTELDAADCEDLFTRRVDNALYEAKRRGRNRVETA